MTWAPDPDPHRVAKLRERGAQVFGHLAAEAGEGIAVYFPHSSPVFIECWRDPAGNSRLLLLAYVDHEVNWTDERIVTMLLEPSNAVVARPVRLRGRLVLMVFLPDEPDDTLLSLYVQGVAFDEGALRGKLSELDEAHSQTDEPAGP